MHRGRSPYTQRPLKIDAADSLLSRAIKGKSIRITSRSSQIFEVKFDPLKKHSVHPYALWIPQNVTELVLGQKLQSLGVEVHRPHRVVGMKQNEKDSRITDVSFEDGQVIRARYIIGADGARSIIRTIAGIGFSDPGGPNLANNSMTQMIFADVTFEPEPVTPLTVEGRLNGTVFSGNIFILLPFGNHFNAELTRDGEPTTKSVFRVGCAVPLKNGEPSHAPPKEYFQDLIDTYGPACITSDPSLNPTPVKVDQLIWSTRFGTHSAIADRTFTRFGAAIFPPGHEPGHQDAIFLAEVVTKHTQASVEDPDVDDTMLQEIADVRPLPTIHTLGGCRVVLAGAATGFWKGISLSTSRFSNSSSASVSSIEPLDRPESPAMSTPDIPTTSDEFKRCPPFDTSLFRSYLESLLPPVLGALPEESVGLFDEEFDERVTRFAAEGGGVTLVVKTRHEAEEDVVTSLALIKRGLTLDPVTPLATQLHILNLFGGEETPHESLHAVVRCGVKPWFDAFVGAWGGGKDGDSKMGPKRSLPNWNFIQRAVEQARASGARPNISHIPQKQLDESSFLNTLHGHVNMWIKAIQAVTKLSRDVSSGTTSQEIRFRLSLERALEGIEAQLHRDDVTMSSTDLVHKYNQLMKDFPLNELLSATDLEKIQESLVLIFGHINRKLKLSPYPIRRALPLVEAISRDFNDQLLRVLTSHRLSYTPYETFDRLLGQTMNIFRTWDDLIKEFTNVAREVMRKRGEKFVPIKVVAAHAYLRDWRKQHEQLAVMTGPTKGLGNMTKEVGGMDMEEEVKEAYEVVKRIDILDVSVEGTKIWVAAENAYNERVARVENQIIARLRDRLGTARNANEMFRIRGAIQEYETQLIDSVEEDIKRLHDKFKTQYRFSEAYHMSQMRDIAGAIIWARQIERQLLTYMKRVEDVLGKGWELYAEGQKLQSESTAFRKKLETRPVYDAWLHDINRRDMGVNGRPFEIEVRNLSWLDFQVPHAITNMAKDAKRVYPHAVSLSMETVRSYGQTLDLVENNMGVEWLVAGCRNEAQRMFAKGMSIKWDCFVNQYDTARYVTNADGREN
ncbi:dynein heavy chain, N-terminal region 1-domain-containing protein [Suillus subluteus]|nr:dynein heavy chain, N-terminal region 1-domain-containing protein [Suillus subluteus]